MNTLNKISPDDYLRIEGAKMMARAVVDFIASTRATNGSGAVSPDTIGVEGKDGNPYCYVKGVTTDMLLDAVVRLTTNTFDCHSFIYGDYPHCFKMGTAEKKGKSKPTKITFQYRRK